MSASDFNIDIKNQISGISCNLTKPVALVGMMGTGKSHLGRLLAQALDVEFHDSDRVVETKAGLSIPRIFEKSGEEKFRAMEKETILSLLNGGKCVIATGGGAVCDAGTLEALLEKSVCVWVKSEVDEIARRVGKDRNARPMLRDGDLLAVLRGLLAAREPFYRRAHIHVDAVPGSVEKTLESIINALSRALKADSF